jgi:putative transposase
MPRVRAELLDQGVRISGKRVARLMRINAIRGVSRRRNFIVTTRRDQRQRPAPDLVKREFEADGPNQLGVADMTYVPTWAASSSWPSCSMSGVGASWAGRSASR